jgi:hypothetical protein
LWHKVSFCSGLVVGGSGVDNHPKVLLVLGLLGHIQGCEGMLPYECG